MIVTTDENREVSLNHKDQGAPHGGASCRDSVTGDLHWYPGVSIVGDVLQCFISPANRDSGSSMRLSRSRLQSTSRRRGTPPKEFPTMTGDNSQRTPLLKGWGVGGIFVKFLAARLPHSKVAR
jgi:hypothetical protein